MKRLAAMILAAMLFLPAGCGKAGAPTQAPDGENKLLVRNTQPAEETQQPGPPAFTLSENGMTKYPDKLIWATNAEFAPYEYLDENGEIIGLEAEIASYIVERLGLAQEIQDINFDSVLDAVVAGDADMGVAALTVTEDRLEKVDFTEPYVDSVQVLIVKSDSTIASIDDLEGTVGVLLGSFGYQYAKEHVENAEINRFNNSSDILNALLLDEIDAVIIDYESAQSYIGSSGNVKILPGELAHERCAIAINKQNPKLCEAINEIIMEMKDNGKMDEILAKYLS